MLKKFQNKKILASLMIAVFLVVIACLFFNVETVWAAEEASKWTGHVLTWMVAGINFLVKVWIWICGNLLVLIMKGVVIVAQYNDFINSPFVKDGWKMMRDIVNMFFILGLLFIAFVTVLKIEKYQWNKLLGKLLIMAILVNFSRTICGIIIDFFQVVMLTFVNSIVGITEGNIFGGTGMIDWFKANEQAEVSGGGDAVKAIGASILGAVYTTILVIIMIIFLVQLVFRIIALWILIVFSPLAFFAYVFEETGIGSVSKRWWSMFMKYCMIGPFLAFFLWLSLLTMAQLSKDPCAFIKVADCQEAAQETAQGTFSAAGKWNNILAFIISTILLVAGLQYSGQFSVVGSGMASGAIKRGRAWGGRKLEGAARRGMAGTKAAVKAPYTKAVRPTMARMGQRAYRRGGPARLATKRGRREAYERGKARVGSFLSGTPLDKRQVQRKQSEGMLKELKKTGQYQDPVAMSRGLKKAAKQKDRTKMEAFANGLAEQGALNPTHVAQMRRGGMFKKMNEPEQIDFGENLERKNEQAGGSRVPVSPLRWDPDTQTLQARDDFSEVKNFVKNSQKDRFVQQANRVGFGNPGEVPDAPRVGDPAGDEKARAARENWQKNPDRQVWQEDINRQQKHAVAELTGAANNQFIGSLAGPARNRLVKKLDFIVSSSDARKDMLETEERVERDPITGEEKRVTTLTEDSAQLAEDVYRRRKPDESHEDYRKAALEHYKEFDPTADRDLIDDQELAQLNNLRAKLTTEYDASGRPVQGSQGQGFTALDPSRLNSNIKDKIQAVGPPSPPTVPEAAEREDMDAFKERERNLFPYDRKQAGDIRSVSNNVVNNLNTSLSVISKAETPTKDAGFQVESIFRQLEGYMDKLKESGVKVDESRINEARDNLDEYRKADNREAMQNEINRLITEIRSFNILAGKEEEGEQEGEG